MVQTQSSKTLCRAQTTAPAAARAAAARPAAAHSAPCVQASLTVSKPADPAEKEAVTTAHKVMRMTLPAGAGAGVVESAGGGHPARLLKPEDPRKKVQASFQSPYVSRFVGTGLLAPAGTNPRATGEPPHVTPAIAAEIQGSQSGGMELPAGVRRFMEPRFRANFGKVRIHANEKSARLSRQLNARAFTVGHNIFFGHGEFQPGSEGGRELIAHELTHTIQQGAAVQRSAAPAVTQQSPPAVQRFGMSDALNFFADKANLIPGFRLFTLVLGMNPINQTPVERTAANLLRALVEFLPGGGLVTQALDNYGIFEKVGAWISQQIQTLGLAAGAVKKALSDFVSSLSWSDVLDLGGVWDRAKRIFTEPIDRLLSFAKGLLTGIIQFVKDAILLPLAKLAEGTPGWDLLKAVLGKDPITGLPVPRTAENLIGPLLKLAGEEEIWNNMVKSNAIPRAWAWFQGALAGLMGFVSQIPALFVAALKSLELVDIVLLPRAFVKVATVFGGFVGQFISWAGTAIWNLLEIIFDVVSPGALAYIKKTGAALKSILKNPLPFLGNLVRAAKLGFMNFGSNFVTHLKAGLIDWLTGSLPGVYIPKAFSLGEMVKFVFSVLGISWANLRQKLVKVLGEPTVKAMETGFDIVVTLVTQGPAAAWDKIKEQLANLKDMVVGGIIDFVKDTMVQKAVPKLIAMFIPGAGFISAILSIYDTVMVFVNKLAQIAAAVKAFVDSIVAIAAGQIDAAAEKVESTLAGLLSLAINFLAGFVGLGKVADKLMGVINKVRSEVDKAMDWLVNWIVTAARKLFAKGKAAVAGALEWWKQKQPFQTAGGESHEVYFAGDEKNPVPMVASKDPQPVLVRLAAFEAQAKGPNAKPRETKALPLIQATKTAVTKSPPDIQAVGDGLAKLFDVFLGTVKPKEKPKVEFRPKTLAGDTVTQYMKIDWWDAEHATGGSDVQGGALPALSSQLDRTPTKRSTAKYVWGHLLNQKLGGKGDQTNLFPITAFANKQHQISTEDKIKPWLDQKDQWIMYEVKVDGIQEHGNPKAKPATPYWVDCQFNCSAVLKDADGNQMKTFVSTITSTYEPDTTKIDATKQRDQATKFDLN